MFLTDNDILRLIHNEKLIENYGSIDDQLQPNGFDFRLDYVQRVDDNSFVQITPTHKVTATLTTLSYDFLDQVQLVRGAYIVSFKETVNIPNNILGLARPRSTLCRSGISLHTGVWDAGYSGKSVALLVVHVGAVVLGKDTRIMQMVFGHLTDGAGVVYNGQYQNEGITTPMVAGSDVYGHDVYV